MERTLEIKDNERGGTCLLMGRFKFIVSIKVKKTEVLSGIVIRDEIK